jgi:2-desacetyl-2-hydroxyethyl bacteriochlorophyllide A dehydrogenase|tara:strand:+ start:402 stop:1385 length:984 start_codon:yes stop_codon:yes gene_type:complete
MKTFETESFWINKKNNSCIKKHIIDAPGKSEALIETIYSGISYGTEKIVYTGDVPKSQRELMRCPYQMGDFGSDVKYGYINVGKVIKGSPKYNNKYVYTLFPHQTVYVLNEADLILIPKSIPLQRCLLTANMETAVNGMWDTLPSCGDKVLIIGAGIVGFLMAYVLKSIIGIEVLLVDIEKSKKQLAEKFNFNFKTSIPKAYQANIIYECSGNPSMINTLSSHIKDEATICVLSWYGNSISKINFGKEFLSKRVKFIFSQVSKVSHNRSKYWNNYSRRELAIKLLNDNKLDYLIEKDYINFYDLPKFFSGIDKHKKFYCKVVNYKKN